MTRWTLHTWVGMLLRRHWCMYKNRETYMRMNPFFLLPTEQSVSDSVTRKKPQRPWVPRRLQRAKTELNKQCRVGAHDALRCHILPREVTSGPPVSHRLLESHIRPPSVTPPPGESHQTSSVTSPPGESHQAPSVTPPTGESYQAPSVTSPPRVTSGSQCHTASWRVSHMRSSVSYSPL